MIIHWDGKQYALDFADLTLRQAEVIETESGLSIDAWLDSLENPARRLKFIKLAYWLMLAQNGEEIPVATVNFKLVPFGEALAAALAAAQPAEASGEAEPDPTRAPPSTPTSASPPAPPSPDGTEVPASATAS